jgi:hypothetical protein
MSSLEIKPNAPSPAPPQRNRFENRARSEKDRAALWKNQLTFWLSVIERQKRQCETAHPDLFDFAADLIFYIDAIGRLRDIAKKMKRKPFIPKAAATLEAFDRAWPDLKDARDLLEHVLEPAEGLAMQPGALVIIAESGLVTEVITVRRIHPAVRALARSLRAAVDEYLAGA